MSGIAGVYNLDGAPVDRALLERMTGALAHRGPDGIRHWVDGPVGMGHCMLQTTPESVYERQPLTDDSGNLCLTMDGRVDNREELIAAIESKGSRLRDHTDAEIVLKAYECWGTECLARIIGDFCFVIWDKPRQQLFAATDQLGVKVLYYASVGKSLLFSNSIFCLRSHRDVTAKLNERAIGDFLLFDCNMDLSTTTFSDIQRLPPGHCLTCSKKNQTVCRYWSFTLEDEIHYGDKHEYVEQFKELLRKAVGDRLRAPRAAVLMSGGLDSSSVAATACEVFRESGGCDLQVFTSVYDRLMQDQERYYSGLVAQALGVPISFLPVDEYRLYARAEQPQYHTPEPMNEPFQAMTVDLMKQVAKSSRVALTGDGGDPVFYGDSMYFIRMLGSFRLGELAKGMTYYYFRRRKLPRLGLRTMLRRALGIPHTSRPEYPTWLNPSFEAKYKLPERWEEKMRPVAGAHPRAGSYEALTNPLWQQLFASYTPDATASSVDVRYPFLDVRLIRYLLRIPSLPWCFEKVMLRVAMQGRLPESVRMRPKTPIVSDPILVRLREKTNQPLCVRLGEERTLEYVDRTKVANSLSLLDSNKIWADIRPISLAYWLSGAHAS